MQPGKKNVSISGSYMISTVANQNYFHLNVNTVYINDMAINDIMFVSPFWHECTPYIYFYKDHGMFSFTATWTDS